MKREPMVVRFWRKVDKQEDGCWVWTGSRSLKLKKPYGMFRVHRYLTRRAHILSYELYYGPVTAGLEIDHICRNTMCVNPEHLEAVTHAENIRRGLRGRLCPMPTHCAHGHELTYENTQLPPDRRFRCRECRRQATSRFRAKMKG